MQYDLEKPNYKDLKMKYSSINNFFEACINGAKKIGKYSTLRKILLVGFFISSMFITYAVCNIKGITSVKESDFIRADKNYLQIKGNKIGVEDFIKCENLDSVDYVLPGNSIVNFKIKFDDYYQTSGKTYAFEGSLCSINTISNTNIIKGRMPNNEYEIVLDKMIYDRMVKDQENGTISLGIKSEEEILDKKVMIDNMKDFAIVGLVDRGTYSIYTNKNMFINIINNTNLDGVSKNMHYGNDTKRQNIKVSDYNLYLDDIRITKGRLPENNYEVIVNVINKDDIKLNKTIDEKVNNNKLVVVGYYDSKTNRQDYLVNNDTVKYNLICQSIGEGIMTNDPYRINSYTYTEKDVIAMVYPKDKEKALNTIKGEYNLNISDKYEKDRANNQEERKDVVSNTITFVGIVLAISLIEIYLIIRSSFLSRTKEVRNIKSSRNKKIRYI